MKKLLLLSLLMVPGLWAAEEKEGEWADEDICVMPLNEALNHCMQDFEDFLQDFNPVNAQTRAEYGAGIRAGFAAALRDRLETLAPLRDAGGTWGIDFTDALIAYDEVKSELYPESFEREWAWGAIEPQYDQETLKELEKYSAGKNSYPQYATLYKRTDEKMLDMREEQKSAPWLARKIRHHSYSIKNITISPSGNLITSTRVLSDDYQNMAFARIYQYDMYNQERVKGTQLAQESRNSPNYIAYDCTVDNLTVSPTDKALLVFTENFNTGPVAVSFDANTKKETTLYKFPKNVQVKSLCFSANGHFLIGHMQNKNNDSASYFILDAKTGDKVEEESIIRQYFPEGLTLGKDSLLTHSHDNELVATVTHRPISWNKSKSTITLYDAVFSKELSTIKCNKQVTSVSLSRDNQVMAYAVLDDSAEKSTIELWQITPSGHNSHIKTLATDCHYVYDLNFSPDGEQIVYRGGAVQPGPNGSGGTAYYILPDKLIIADVN
jgi:hypothetical protein